MSDRRRCQTVEISARAGRHRPYRESRIQVMRHLERKRLPPGDRFRRRVLALSRIGDPAGKLRTRVGDRRAQRFLAVLGLRLAAIALPAEYHADLDADAVAVKSGRNDE